RLDTWMVEIAEAARGTTAKESGDGFRLGAKGSLWIGRSAIFRDFEADLGGRGAFRLLQHVNGLDFADALQAARKWLSGHPGAGRLGTPDDAYDETLEVSEADAARQAFLDTLWAGAAPAEG